MTEASVGGANEGARGAAYVVGGTGGLGAAICRRLARDWDAVYFTYRSNADAAAALKRDLEVTRPADCSCVDLRQPQSIRASLDDAVERFGPVRTVVFAAGAKILQPYVADITAQEWDDVIQDELLGFTHLVRETLPMFRKQGGGSLVSVVSFATYHFPPGDALSAVPKAAIEMLGKAIAREEGRYGIRANAVAPGIINAGLGDEFQKTLFNPEIWRGQRNRVPLKRFGEADEVADAVAFLASDQARYITGQTIIVDGGLHL